MNKVDYGDKVQWFDESLDEWVEGAVVKGVYSLSPFICVKRYDNDEYEYVSTRDIKKVL